METKQAEKLVRGMVAHVGWLSSKRLVFTRGDVGWFEVWMADVANLGPGQTIEQHYQDEIDYFTRVINSDPNSSAAQISQVRTYLRALGERYYDTGRYQDAIKTWLKREKLGTGLTGLDCLNLARVHQVLAHEREAQQWYIRGVQWVIENEPEDEHLRSFRGNVARYLGIKAEPDDGKPPVTAGEITTLADEYLLPK